MVYLDVHGVLRESYYLKIELIELIVGLYLVQ